MEAYRDPVTGQPSNRAIQKLEKLHILERARLIYQHEGQKHLDQQEWLAMLGAGDLTKLSIECRIGDCYAEASTAVLRNYLEKSGMERLLKKHLGRKAGRLIFRSLNIITNKFYASLVNYIKDAYNTETKINP